MKTIEKTSIEENRFYERGFTIIELLIATVVFSFVMLVIATGIIRLGNMYYKGVISSRTQDVVRNISSEITTAIQFSSDDKTVAQPVGGGGEKFCFGSTRYTFFKNSKYTKGQESTSGLYIEELPVAANCQTATATSAKQALGNNMRLLAFSIDPMPGTSNIWQVNIKVAYGDDDLLFNPDGSSISNSNYANATCKTDIAGSSFCAVAQLDTYVKKRLI